MANGIESFWLAKKNIAKGDREPKIVPARFIAPA
jgi:hypothetical protein